MLRVPPGRRWPALLGALALAALAPLDGRAAGPITVEVEMAGVPRPVDVWWPARAPAAPIRGAAVLAHGFTRSRATMAGHAEALAARGVAALAPDLPFLVDARDNARALADLVGQVRAGAFVPAIDRVVLVGFSAGALASLLAAATPGVVGLVALDPFDRPGGVGRAFARTLATPALIVRAPASACNAFSIAEPWARALPALIEDRLIPGASHCDFESPTDRVCRWICGATDARRQQAVLDALLEAVDRWLPAASVARAGPPRDSR